MLKSKYVKILLFSLLMQVVAFGSLQLVPANPEFSNKLFLFLLNFFFLFLVFSFSSLVYFFLPKKEQFKEPIRVGQLYFNVYFSSFMSVLGFLFILYDRAVMRGIDFSSGLRTARYNWLATPGMNFWGIAGNLIIPLGFFSLFLLITNYPRFELKHKLLLLFSCIVSIAGLAALNGGRSNVLIALFVGVAFFLFSAPKNLQLKKINLIYLFLMLLSILWGYYITSQSAAMTSDSSYRTLTKLGIEELFGVVGPDFDKYSNESIYLCYYILAYLFHGNWTAELSYFFSPKYGNCTLYPISILLTRLGILDQPLTPSPFEMQGAFISLPGAIYYDYGVVGCILLFALIGIFLGVASYLLTYRSLEPITISFCLFFVVLVFMAPILPAYALVYFDFVIYIFIAMGVLNKILFPRSRDWLNYSIESKE